MAEVVRQGIEKANQDLEQEEQKKLAQEASDITSSHVAFTSSHSCIGYLVIFVRISGLGWFPPNSPNLD